MIDLNEIDEAPTRFDLDEIRERLADTAYSWVPALFPNGRLAPDRKTLRCADLSGRAPTGEGSCVITLTGPYAGWAYDFATGEKAGPIDLIAYATGLSRRNLFEEAARIAGMDSAIPRPKPAPRPRERKDFSIEISRIRDRCVSLAGTVGEHYLSTRGLNDPACPDLLFNPDVNDYDMGLGFPALVAIVRGPDGRETGGLHRTYLLEDGNGKAPPGKKMIGPVEGGAVQLAPTTADGSLAVAEGIETALSVAAIFNVPCWATLSREHMIAWQCPANVSHVTIYADAGEPGVDGAEKLATRLRGEGKTVEIKIPMYGDDFNSDLQRGVTADEYPVETRLKKTFESKPKTVTEFENAANLLPRSPDQETLTGFLDALVVAQLQPIAEGQILARIKKATGVNLGSLRSQLQIIRRQMKSAGDPPKPPWFGQLQLDLSGNPERNERNVITAFNNDPAFAGCIVFDDFAQKIQVMKPLPWELNDSTCPRDWSDNDDVLGAVWLQQRNINIPSYLVGRSIGSVAREITVHPVRDYLQSLVWDGVARIETFAIDYLGAEDTPLHRRFAALWMISAVARIMNPGCKVDHMLILEGPQELKKSTALKELAGKQWFTDEIADLGSKDAAQQMSGVWVIEVAELDALNRSDVSRIKAFLTRTIDRYRPPYGRAVVSIPRQCVFAGTVNPDTYLRDETGNRRFWPIRCTKINIEAIQQDRDQLWAEAVARYEGGAIWWLNDPKLIGMAKDEQAARLQDEAWDSLIDDWLMNDGPIKRFEPITDASVAQILREAIKIEPAKWTRADQMRVSAYLKRNGWKRYQTRKGGCREWRYRCES